MPCSLKWCDSKPFVVSTRLSWPDCCNGCHVRSVKDWFGPGISVASEYFRLALVNPGELRIIDFINHGGKRLPIASLRFRHCAH